VSSVRRGNRHIVAVVLGGASGGARDARMRSLIEQHIASAAINRSVAKIAEATEVSAVAAPAAPAKKPDPRLGREDAPVTVASIPVEKAEIAAPAAAAVAAPAATLAQAKAPQPGSGEPINPIKVKTITVKAGAVQTASLGPLVMSAPQATVAPAHFAKHAPAEAPLPAPPGARPGILGTLPIEAVQAPQPQRASSYQTASAASVPVMPEPVASRAVRGPWIIQVGAFPKETEALERLREAQAVGKPVLARAEPFTEKFVKGTQEYFRARFDGFSQASAEGACRYFKRAEMPCLAIRN
jgi:D-alanyl-D-alanine carboxypeptidase